MEKKFRTGALIVNGKPFKRKIAADIIAAADGGFNLLKNRGITPDIVIGDMDSIVQAIDVPVTVLPRVKDITDGEAALDYLIDKGCTRIDIYAATSGRLDHIFGHIALLERALTKNVTARLIDDEYEIYLTNKKLELNIPQFVVRNSSFVISLLPLTPKVHIMSTNGLAYPLENEILVRTATRGISNIATSEKITIDVADGLLLVIIVR